MNLFEDYYKQKEKECLYCKETKTLSLFPKKKGSKDGHDSRCLICKRQSDRDLRKLHKNSFSKNPEICKLCHRKNVPMVLDHNHVSGLERGRICNKCNTALGQLGDTPESLERCISYLKGELNE